MPLYGTTPDATTSTKGKIQLAGVLAGTASSPTIRGWDGWQDANESWSYSSWTSGTRIGEITVPTDATTKYSNGMRIRIVQSTGGTKCGIIHKVVATTLTVFFPSGTTLNNEAISSPYYSGIKIPFGFNTDSTAWTLTLTDTTLRDQATPTSGVWYNVGSLSLAVGIGLWDVALNLSIQANYGGSSYCAVYGCVSNANNTAAYPNLIQGGGAYQSSGNDYAFLISLNDQLALTSATTLYVNGYKTGVALNHLYFLNTAPSNLYLKVTSGYL